MQCSVAGCRNDTKNVSRSRGITFHRLPKNPNIAKAWLKALGRDPLLSNEKFVVCSEHFLNEDLYETKSGIQKVRIAAVPLVFQVCRICLASDLKLISITNYKLEMAYSELTGVCLDEDTLPKYLCMECAQRLINCSRFRQKSYRAHHMLMQIINKRYNRERIQDNFKTLNREKHKLVSSLKTMLNEPDHYDYILEYREPNQYIDEPEIKIEVNSAQETNIVKIETLKDVLYYNMAEDLKVDVCDTNFDTDNLETHSQQDDVIDSNNDSEKTQYDISDTNNDTDGLSETINDSDNDDEINKDFNEKDIELSKSSKLKTIKKQSRKRPAVSNSIGLSSSELLAKGRPLIVTKVFETKKRRKTKEVDNKNRCETKEVDDINRSETNEVDDKNELDENDPTVSIFTINRLTDKEAIDIVKKRQESESYIYCKFKCNLCFKGFSYKDVFDKHMLRHSDAFGKYECQFCKIRYKSSVLRTNHITAYHRKKYSCNNCDFVCLHRRNARLHQEWHKGITYKCPHCGDEFDKFTSHMNHMRIRHPSDFVCEMCGYSYVSEKGKELHKKLSHRTDEREIPEDGPFCEQCNIRFVSEEALSTHLGVSPKHNLDMKPKLSNNGRSAPRKRIIHKKISSNPPMPCEQCGIKLENIRAYNRHFRAEHKDKNRTYYPLMKTPHMCDVCGKLFPSRGFLEEHSLIHIEGITFTCDTCSKVFASKKNLILHINTHSMRKLYPCKECGKVFTNNSNRTRHKAVHTDLRPFKCDMCDKHFKSQKDTNSHIKHVHFKNPWPKRKREKRTDCVRESEKAV